MKDRLPYLTQHISCLKLLFPVRTMRLFVIVPHYCTHKQLSVIDEAEQWQLHVFMIRL